jgi:hypothetical protein
MYCVRQAQSLHSWGVRRASFFGKHCFCKNWVGSMLWGSKGFMGKAYGIACVLVERSLFTAQIYRVSF